jgi:hypothetical protein
MNRRQLIKMSGLGLLGTVLPSSPSLFKIEDLWLNKPKLLSSVSVSSKPYQKYADRYTKYLAEQMLEILNCATRSYTVPPTDTIYQYWYHEMIKSGVRRDLNRFLDYQYKYGIHFPELPHISAYEVICDRTNNTEKTIKENYLFATVKVQYQDFIHFFNLMLQGGTFTSIIRHYADIQMIGG